MRLKKITFFKLLCLFAFLFNISTHANINTNNGYQPHTLQFQQVFINCLFDSDNSVNYNASNVSALKSIKSGLSVNKMFVPPVITCPGIVIQSNDLGNCSAVVNSINLTTDGTEVLQTWTLTGATTGSSPGTGINDASGQIFNVGVTTVTYYVENAGTESSTCNFTVTITDDENPTVTAAADVTADTSDDGAGDCDVDVAITNATFNDNCSSTLTWAMTGAVTDSGAGQVGTYNFPNGLTTITYTNSDGVNTNATDAMTVTVSDDENPTVTAAADVTADTSDDGAGDCDVDVAITNATFNDNCSSTLTWAMTGAVTDSGAGQVGTYNFPNGLTTITYTNSDGVNTNATDAMTVTVSDDENPTVTAAADVTADTSDDGAGDCDVDVAITNATFNDNCSSTLTWAMTGAVTDSGAGQVGTYNFPNGLTTITYTNSDGVNTNATDAMTVTVSDDENPTVTAAADVTADTSDDGAGDCDVDVAITNATFNDNCSSTLTWAMTGAVTDSGAGQVGTYNFPNGLTTITYTNSDGVNTNATDAMTVTVSDDENPTVTAAADVTADTSDDGAGDCDVDVAITNATFNDNCSSTLTWAMTGAVTDSGAGQVGTYNFPNGLTTITYTNSDGVNTNATDAMTVTVSDDENPTVTAAADVTADTSDDGAGDCDVDVAITNATFNDNCSSTLTWAMTGAVTDSGAGQVGTYNFPNGLTTITYTNSDGVNTNATDAMTVTVSDDEDPAITCPSDIPVTNTPSTCGVVVNYTPPVGTDNCSGAVTTQTDATGLSSGSTFPVGTTTLEYTVTDSSGNTDICSFDIIVTDAAANASVNIGASATTICENTSVTFTATPTDGGASPSYQWQVNGGNVGTDSPTFTTSTLINADAVTVIMTSSLSACGTTATSNVINMTINAASPVSFNINGTSTICSGDSVTFSPGPITNGGVSPDYEWFVNGGSVATTQNYTTSSLNDGDIVTMEVTSYVQCATPVPATSTNSILVTVNPLPVANNIIGATEVCFGSTIDLTEGTAGTIVWNSSNPAIATVNGSGLITPVASGGGTTNITYTVTNGNGCTSASSAVHAVTVNPLPVANNIIGATEVCFGSTIDLTEGTAGTIVWNSSNPAIATVNGSGLITPVASGGGTTNITYTVTDGNGCTSASSAVHAVTVNPLPVANNIIGATEVCFGSTIDLTEGTAGTIVWNSSNPAIATVNGSGLITPVASGGGTTNITYTVTDGNGCTSASSAVHAVTVNPLPVANNIIGATEVCFGSTIDLTEGTAGTIVWNSSNPAIATVNGSGLITPVASGGGTTNITYTVTDGNGCTSASSAVHAVTVNPLPVANNIIGATEVCFGSTIDLTEGTAGTIVWNSSNPAIATVNGSGLITPVASGGGTTNITYTVTDGNGCTSASSAVHAVTVNPLPVANNIIGATEVCFGSTIDLTEGTAGTIVWNSSNPAIATVNGSGLITPVASGGGTTNITYTVTDGNGCTSASSAVHAVTVNPLPVANNIIGATEVCFGSTIDLTEGTAGTIVWNSSNPAIATVNGSGLITPVASGGGTTNITYTVTDGNGCTSASSAVHAVTVNPLPVANNIIGATEVCFGSTIDLTEGTAGTIVWNSSNPAIATVNGSGLITPVASGGGTTNITYTVTDGNGCTSASSAVHAVTVNPLPVANNIIGATEVCFGSTIDLTEGTAGTIVWNSSNPAIATVNGSGLITPVASGGGTTNITYTVTDGNGCTSASSAVHAVTVNPLPVANNIIGATEVCFGSTIDLTEGTAGTIVWNSSNPAIATVNGSGLITPVASGGGTTNITYTVTNGNGCTSASSAVHAVTVNPLPVANNIIGATEVCFGSTIDLTEGTAGTIVWNSSNPAIATVNGSGLITPVASGGGTTNITYTVTDGNGCTSASSAVHAVTVNPLLTPSVTIGSTATAICTGTNVTFTATPTNGGSSPSYQWYVDATPVGSNSSTYSSTTLNNGEVVSVVMTPSADVCVSPSTATSNSITMTVYTTPSIPGTIAGDDAICPVITGAIYSVVNDTNIVTYNWSTPTGFTITSGAGTNSITVNVSALAADGDLTVTATNLCGTSSSSILPISIGTFAAANAGPDQTVCDGTTQITLDGSVGGAIRRQNQWDWTDNGAGGSFAQPNKLNSVYNFPGGFGPGDTITITIYTIDPAGSCPAVSDDMIITMLADATITNPGNKTQTICFNSAIAPIIFTIGGAGSGATVSGLPTGVTGSYSSGTFTISGTPSVTGTFNYTVNTTGTCPQTSETGTITIDPLATVGAGSDQTVCSDAPDVTLAGSVGGGASSGSWSGGAGSYNPNNSTLNAVYTPSAAEITAGTVTLTLNTDDPTGPCDAISDTMTITINPEATVGAGSDQTVCSDAPDVTLAGSVGGGASSGSWSGGAGSYNPNNSTLNAVYTPSAAEITAGTVTLTLNTDDPTGPCDAISDTMTITINPEATVGAGSDQTVCSDAPDVTLAGSVGGGASSGSWSGGAGSYNPNNSTLNAVYTPSAAEITAGTVTLTLNTDDPTGPCDAISDTMTITINPEATVGAGSDQTVCSDAPDVTLAGSVGGGASSGSWSGGAGSYNPNNSTLNAVYTPSAAEITAGTVTLTLNTDDPTGPCDAISDTMTITINPEATVGAGSDQTVCSDAPDVTLAGSVGGGASSGSWSGGAGSYNPNNSTLNAVYTPSAAEITAGTVTLTLNTDDPTGPCDAISDTMTITINPEATVGAGSDQTVCSDAPDVTLAGSVGGGASSGSWSGGAGSYNPNNSTLNAVYTPSAAEITAGTVTLTLNTDDPTGPCDAISDTMTITINPEATVGAGSDQTVCSDAPDVTLAGSVGGGASSGSWSGGAGSYNPNNSTLNAVYTPSAAEITAGTVTLTLNTDDPTGPCDAISDTMTITINPEATVGAGSDQTVCSDAPDVTLAGSVGGGASSGSWSGGAGSYNPNNSTLNAVYTPSAAEITAGTVTLTLNTDDPTGPCDAISDTMTITINPEATVGAGSDQTVCSDAPDVTLAGSVGGGASSGSWSGGAGSYNPNNSTLNAVYTPSAAEITAGTVTLTLNTDDPTGPCDAISDTMTITINPEATVGAGSDQTVCSDAPDVTLAGSVGGGASSGSWSGGAGSYNPNNSTLNAVYTPSAAEITAGTVTLTLNTDDPTGPCDAISDTMTITINPEATVGAGSDQTVCSDAPDVTLAGSVGGGASSGSWSGGAGSYNPNNSTLNAVYTPSAAEITAGTVTLTLNTDDPTGPCDAISDTMTITIKAEIIITTQPQNVGVCVTEPASLSVVAVGDDRTYQWYKGTAPGTPVSNTGNISGATTNVLSFSMAAISDAETYYVIISGDASCSNVTSQEVTLNVNQVINITDQPDPVVDCEGSDVTFTVVATGSIAGYQWRKNGVNIGGATGTSLTLTNITTADDADYDVVITSPGGLCSSAYSLVVSLTVTETPTASISYTGTPFCDTLGAGQTVTLTGTNAYTGGNYSYSVDSGGPTLSLNTTTGDINPSASSPGTYTVTYTGPTTGGCAAATDDTTVVITDLPTASISYAGTPFCDTLGAGQTVTLTGTNAYTGGNYSYSVDSGGPTLSLNTTTGDINPSASSPGTYTVTYTGPTTGGCAAATDDTTVVITDLPTASISYAGTPFCDTLGAGQTVTLTGTNAYTGGNYSYSVDSGGPTLSLNTTTGDINPSASSPGTYTVTYTGPTTGGCAAATDDTTVVITDLPTASISYAGTPFCDTVGAGQTVTLTGTNDYLGGTFSAPGGLTIDSGSGDINPSTSTSGTYLVTYTGPTTGGCAAATDDTTVVITDLPTASISYAGTPFCDTVGAGQTVTLTGTNDYLGGTFSAPGGLTIDSGSGDINPSTSTSGTYLVTYTGPTTGGCAAATDDTTVVITGLPTASISYAGTPFCDTVGAGQTVTLTGTNDYLGGTFSAPGGLTIDSGSGDINPSTSTSGTYLVTYTGPTTGGCAAATDDTTVVITDLPTASISYAGTPFCDTVGAGQTVTLTGTNDYLGGTFSAPGGLTIDSGSGDINPSTSTPGTYLVTYTGSTSGGCAAATDNTSVTITALPTAAISYSDTVYCESDSNTYAVNLIQTDGTSGTYSYVANTGGPTLSINTTTGTISPSSSNVGTYTITYTIPGSAGCGVVTATYDVEIENEPDATFSYSSASYCSNESDPSPTVTEGGGVFSSSPATGALNSSTGVIDLSVINSGAYTIYYTFAAVNGGCAQVQESQSVTVSEYVAGGTIEGYAEDDLGVPGPTSSEIIACHDGNGELTLDIGGASTSYIQEWQYSTNNGAWTTVPGTNAGSLTYNFVGLTGLTAYRAVIDTGVGCSVEYSELAFVSVIPPDLKPEPVSASPTEFCLNDSSIFSSSVNYGAEDLIEGGLFQTGQINTQDPNGWLVDGAVRGLSAAGNNLKNNNWSGTNPHPLTVDGVGPINWDSGQPKYAIAGGVLNQNQTNDPYYYEGGIAMTTLTTPIFSLMTLQNPTFTFDEAFVLSGANSCNGNSYPAGEAIIQISTDGGANWNNIPDDEVVDTSWRTGGVVTGTNSPVVNSGNLSNFNVNTTTVDLSAYFGQPQMRLRFVLIRNCESVWALDNITLPGGAPGTQVQWTDQFGVVISNENTATVTPITPGYQIYTVTTFINGCRSLAPDGSEDVALTVDFAYATAKQKGNICGEGISLYAYDNNKTAYTNYLDLQLAGLWVNGLYTVPSDPSFDYAGTGANGEWSIVSGPGGLGINWATEDPADYFFPSFNDPRAEFEGPSGQYELSWVVHGLGGDCTANVTIDVFGCSNLDFDGRDDNVTFRNDFDLDSGPFSIEIWVKPNAEKHFDNGSSAGPNDPIQTIFSKRDFTTMTNGYDLRLANNKISFNWNSVSGTLISPNLGTSRWYHVAVTYSGGTYKLYIDGIEVDSAAGTNPSNNNFECIMGAMDQSAGGGNPDSLNYFSGWTDELRIWNVELSAAQIRHMMNQEIEVNGTNVRGSIVPIDIPGLSWTDLDAYYQMSQPGDIANGYLLSNVGTRDGQLRKIVTWQDETAPLPYTSIRNGNWNVTTAATPWTYGDSVWDFPNSTGVNGADIDWNIVVTNHDITSNTQDVTLLGLLVEANELTITDTGTQDENNNGHGLNITHYLKLDGVIDLIGESQLVQKRYTPSQVNGSILDVTSSGYLERDQQGTTNLFNYNYWGSPVGPINTTENNRDYGAGIVLQDGTDTDNPMAVAWTGSYDATGSTNPITMSNRWIYAYENYVANTYAAWRYLSNTGTLAAGLSFTMKGSGVGDPVNDVQNYVFSGKPNNGTISTPITSGNNSLVGNPYPSAIDATEFILDNAGSISGTLYFWIHYTSNFTHILEQYEGGYATRNLTGGNGAVVPPITIDGQVISGSGSSSLIPGQYVPVAQGFFIGGSASGGNVVFENDQRVFERETTSNSVFLRSNNSDNPPPNQENNLIKRIRLSFVSPEKAIRPLLLGFVPNNLATDDVDYGYDAANTDEFVPSDMSWMINDEKYLIQGVGDFDKTKQYPVGIFLSTSGHIEIALTALENFKDPVEVFVYDSLLGTYTQINDTSFRMSIDADDYLDRFYITFKQEEINNDDDDDSVIETDDDFTQTIVNYLNSSGEIYIHVPNTVDVKQVYLINLLGQTVRSWNITNMPNLSSDEFKIPVKNISDGSYIIKVLTNTNTINKKVIIKQ